MKTSPTAQRMATSPSTKKKFQPYSRVASPVHRYRSQESEAVANNNVVPVLSSKAVYYDCPICHASLTAGTTCITSCGHLFHKDCVRQWFTYERFCPYCRRGNETSRDLDHELDEFVSDSEDYRQYSCLDTFRISTVARLHRTWPMKEFREMDPKLLFEHSQNAYFVAQGALQKGRLSDGYSSIRRAIHFNDGILNTPQALIFRRVHDMEYRHHLSKCNTILANFEEAFEKYFKERADLENSLCEKPVAAFQKMNFGNSSTKVSFWGGLGIENCTLPVIGLSFRVDGKLLIVDGYLHAKLNKDNQRKSVGADREGKSVWSQNTPL